MFNLESAHSRFQEVVQERTLTDQLPEAYLQWRVEVAAGDFEGIRHCKLQATIREVLHQPSIASAVAHIRPKLDRIRSDALPGQRVNLALSTLRGMLQSLAPRVASAYLRTICNGWITRTRFSGHQWFQHGGHCRFGRTECEDTLQHFAFCPAAAGWYERHANLNRAPFGRELDFFLLLGRECCADQFSRVPGRSQLGIFQDRACALYALYRTHNFPDIATGWVT